MKTLKTKWTGIRPLVMSNPRTVKVSDPFAIEARRLNAAMKAARKKGDENKMLELEPQIIRNDWEASSYWDEAESKFFVPDTLLLASIRGGAAAAKKGKDIERAVIITETQAFIETESTKSLDLAFKNMAFRLECPCKIPPKTGSLAELVRLPLWRACAESMLAEGVEYGKTYTAEYFEQHLRWL